MAAASAEVDAFVARAKGAEARKQAGHAMADRQRGPRVAAERDIALGLIARAIRLAASTSPVRRRPGPSRSPARPYARA